MKTCKLIIALLLAASAAWGAPRKRVRGGAERRAMFAHMRERRPKHRLRVPRVWRPRFHRIRRDRAARDRFRRETGYPPGRPGYVVDHIVPLECGGSDDPSNMQWQTVAAGKSKDRGESKCRA